MAKATFKIFGMDCAEEVATLKSALLPMTGVDDLSFDILNGKMTVEYSDAEIRISDISTAVKKAGLDSVLWQEFLQSKSPSGWARWHRSILTFTSGALLCLGVLAHIAYRGWREVFAGAEDVTTPFIAKIFYAGAIVAGAWFVAPKAWRALLRLRPDMNLLMIVAVCGAVLIDQYLEAATVAFLFALSVALESWSVGRARRAIEALLALTPSKATVLSLGSTDERSTSTPQQFPQDMEVAEIPIGSTLLVRPGQKFPLDGRITKGETTVNEAPITGESKPVEKSLNSEVYAGTVNEDSAVEFITTKLVNETTVARIVQMVGEAQGKRSSSEQWVEKFARYYTPIVMLLAIAVAVVPPILLGGEWSRWFYEGLVLLVIACPCALVISTPVSIVAALASAAREGILVKAGLYIEAPAHLKAIALDKTGTLTLGKPTVSGVIPLSGHDELELVRIAGAIESRSEHPLARAVISYAKSLKVDISPAEDYKILKGRGATAVLDGKKVWVGSHRFLEERGQETAEMHKALEVWSRAGASAIVVGNDEHVCGLIAVSDTIRADARESIAKLKQAGVEHIVMLTGDNQGTALSVSKETGVDDTKYELLPDEKVLAVAALVEKYKSVAMVGDGVNDAPAMARATLGIAMGITGTDVAIETADIALMSDDLSKIAWLIGHSRRTLSIIRQNIAASLGVKFFFMVATILGHGSLWAAIAADTGMSLLVVFNSLRLLRKG